MTLPFTTVDVTVTAGSTRFEPDDERWLVQVSALHRDLAGNVAGFRVESRPERRTRGTVDTIVLALASAGALTCAQQCFVAWLRRDKTRRIVVRFVDRSGPREISIEADTVDAVTFRSAVPESLAAQRDQP